jgi:predicted Zn-dependent protease
MLEPHSKTILAAQGYAELSMYDDALHELDQLPQEARQHATVLELRIVVLMQARRWKAALNSSRELCRLDPDKPTGYIHTAFCMHELGQTSDARDFLLGAPALLHGEATFHYNLACYECQLGNLELARMHLDKSFTLDKKLREFASGDPDLQALRT